ncbi:LOW QUALITY PROTEIN: cytosolic sulfotransferase 5 [Amborella trichopoda]|nr:LOW QUALITY PROTEIN: cytosolic sulfotransferase 5 [Amborella trichopoda]|eukprot:XP_006830394.3 LOW QUALITY PROTEIN: cytosolic sulfotransferase 5 [Amborella trichopoda]
MATHKHLSSQSTDIVLLPSPKQGTTWLKSLLFSIMHHGPSPQEHQTHPLLSRHPHELVPNLEVQIYGKNPMLDISCLASPRLFNTHISYSTLPNSIEESNCKIVYVARNPRDTLVSLWHFLGHFYKGLEPLSFEETFECFCEGRVHYGPFFEHVLEYWEASKERPHNVLFLAYEELKADTKGGVKRIAEFLGRPIEREEEVEGIVEMCSFERLSNLEVNKSEEKAKWGPCLPYNSVYRKGVVGDWANYFTPEMIERLDEITREKLEGSGVEFRFC